MGRNENWPKKNGGNFSFVNTFPPKPTCLLLDLLVLFGDKPHTDLHGALSLTPIIFTLTLSNRAARNDLKFWRPIGYILNIGYGRGTSNKTHTRDKIQDEHYCISFTFQSLKNINKENGLWCVVLGHTVHVKVWIHYFIGDTKGNNKWLGQYPGNREGVRRLYCDCKCQFHDLSNPNPNWIYLTMADINFAKNKGMRRWICWNWILLLNFYVWHYVIGHGFMAGSIAR